MYPTAKEVRNLSKLKSQSETQANKTSNTEIYNEAIKIFKKLYQMLHS